MEMIAVANRSAQLLEHWQIFEMENDGNARLVRRVAKLIIEGVASQLQSAVLENSEWLRDCAGVVFRMHALVKEAEVEVCEEQSQALCGAVECILKPLEQS